MRTLTASYLASVTLLLACADSPVEPAEPTQATVAALIPSHGRPVVDHYVSSGSYVVSCMTFDLRIDDTGRQVVQRWYYPTGTLQRVKLHTNVTTTFTNLTSGAFFTNERTVSVEARFDANGDPIEQIVNGATTRVHDPNGGRLLYFHIGHEVVTFHFNTSPPTIETVFAGHSNSGVVSDECEALGDPLVERR